MNMRVEHWGSKTQPYWHPNANPTVDDVLFWRAFGKAVDTKVLLIRRSDKAPAEPGKWALPGGFQETPAKKGEEWRPGEETARAAALRELAEETGIAPGTVTEEQLAEVGVYEGGGRDPRDNAEAWSRSVAFAVVLEGGEAPPLKAGDDAKEARWVDLREALGMTLAFDHSKILRDACRKMGMCLDQMASK